MLTDGDAGGIVSRQAVNAASMAKQLPLVEVVKTTVRLPKDLHRRLKILSAKQDRSYADLLIDAIEAYLSKHDRSESAATGQ